MKASRFGSKQTVVSRPCAMVDASETLIVHSQSERLAPAEELGGPGGLGHGELVVKRHAPRRIVQPEPIERFE